MRTLILLIFILRFSIPVFGQPFSSGSTGADGAYSPTQSGDFDPVALGLDLDGDNVFHFTTINIPQGVYITLRAWKMRRPSSVYFLASGNVVISGTLDLSGESASSPSNDILARRLTQPGPGGYPGGSGGKIGDTSAKRGYGPGAAIWPCVPAFSQVPQQPGGVPACNQPATTYGNAMLLQLVGGSGGSGGPGSSTSGGGNGGAGGGAIRIVSNTSISLPGQLFANPGQAGACGVNALPGTGGSLHLAAPTVSVTGVVAASFGPSFCNVIGSSGRIRIDSNNLTASGNFNPIAATGPLVNLPVPANTPSLRFLTIGGVNVPANPGGSFTVPDVVINAAGTPTNVQIGASGIPLGTPLSLIIEAEGATPDQLVSTSGLTGSLASSAATASVTFPVGLQRLHLRVIW